MSTTAVNADMSTTAANANMSTTAANANMSTTAANANMSTTAANANMSTTAANGNKSTTAANANRGTTAANANKSTTGFNSNASTAGSISSTNSAGQCDVSKAKIWTDFRRAQTLHDSRRTPTGADFETIPTGYDVNKALFGADINRALYQEMICPQVSVPFWRVVKPFTADCLINNWYEERLKFEKQCYKHNSTYRIDYKPFCSPTVDESVRRKGKLHNENGLPLSILFHHHDDAYYRNKITWYDQTFNGRDARERPAFLGERDWKINLPAWVPERSDFPLQGNPTNWGLLRQLQLKWQKRQREASECNYGTTYGRAYNRSPPLAPGDYVLTRYATLKERSLLSNPTDKINRDMTYKISHQPEILATTRFKPDVCEPKHPPSALYN